jgi:hypothetical protein
MDSTHLLFMKDAQTAANDDNTLPRAMNEEQVRAMSEEAATYAAETERFTFYWAEVGVTTDEGEQLILYGDGKPSCGCKRWHASRVCSHTLALERVLMKLATNDIEKQQQEEGKEGALSGPL